MNNDFKQILKEISSHANTGRMWFEQDEEEDPLAGNEEDPLGGDEDPLAGGDDPLGGDEGGDLFGGDDMGGDMGNDPEQAKIDAEKEKAEAEADAAKAEAEAAKAKADKEKSEAEREKEEAESEGDEGDDMFSHPGVKHLMGILVNDYSEENQLDALAQKLKDEFDWTDKGFQEFKSKSGLLLPIPGFRQLLNRLEKYFQSSTEDEIEDATEKM